MATGEPEPHKITEIDLMGDDNTSQQEEQHDRWGLRTLLLNHSE